MSYIARKTTDDNFEHCAKGLLPFCVASVQNLTADMIRMPPEWGVKATDTLNAIMICAEVAMAFSVERYGKYRMPVPIRAGRRKRRARSARKSTALTASQAGTRNATE